MDGRIPLLPRSGLYLAIALGCVAALVFLNPFTEWLRSITGGRPWWLWAELPRWFLKMPWWGRGAVAFVVGTVAVMVGAVVVAFVETVISSERRIEELEKQLCGLRENLDSLRHDERYSGR